MGKKAGFTAISEVLARALREMNLPEAFLERGKVMQRWGEIAGEEAARHSDPAEFNGRALVVEADDAVWVQELSLRKAELLARIEREAGKGVVDDIRFRLRKGAR